MSQWEILNETKIWEISIKRHSTAIIWIFQLNAAQIVHSTPAVHAAPNQLQCMTILLKRKPMCALKSLQSKVINSKDVTSFWLLFDSLYLSFGFSSANPNNSNDVIAIRKYLRFDCTRWRSAKKNEMLSLLNANDCLKRFRMLVETMTACLSFSSFNYNQEKKWLMTWVSLQCVVQRNMNRHIKILCISFN